MLSVKQGSCKYHLGPIWPRKKLRFRPLTLITISLPRRHPTGLVQVHLVARRITYIQPKFLRGVCQLCLFDAETLKYFKWQITILTVHQNLVSNMRAFRWSGRLFFTAIWCFLYKSAYFVLVKIFSFKTCFIDPKAARNILSIDSLKQVLPSKTSLTKTSFVSGWENCTWTYFASLICNTDFVRATVDLWYELQLALRGFMLSKITVFRNVTLCKSKRFRAQCRKRLTTAAM